MSQSQTDEMRRRRAVLCRETETNKGEGGNKENSVQNER